MSWIPDVDDLEIYANTGGGAPAPPVGGPNLEPQVYELDSLVPTLDKNNVVAVARNVAGGYIEVDLQNPIAGGRPQQGGAWQLPIRDLLGADVTLIPHDLVKFRVTTDGVLPNGTWVGAAILSAGVDDAGTFGYGAQVRGTGADNGGASVYQNSAGWVDTAFVGAGMRSAEARISPATATQARHRAAIGRDAAEAIVGAHNAAFVQGFGPGYGILCIGAGYHDAGAAGGETVRMRVTVAAYSHAALVALGY